MKVNQSPDPTLVRQESTTVALTGVTPQVDAAPNPNINCDPSYRNSFYQYANPDDPADNDLVQGGLYDFDDRHPVDLAEVRAPSVAGNVTLIVEDRTGASKHPTTVHAGSGGYVVFTPPITILPSQVLKASTVGIGTVPNPVWLDIYVVKTTPL